MKNFTTTFHFSSFDFLFYFLVLNLVYKKMNQLELVNGDNCILNAIHLAEFTRMNRFNKNNRFQIWNKMRRKNIILSFYTSGESIRLSWIYDKVSQSIEFKSNTTDMHVHALNQRERIALF